MKFSINQENILNFMINALKIFFKVKHGLYNIEILSGIITLNYYMRNGI